MHSPAWAHQEVTDHLISRPEAEPWHSQGTRSPRQDPSVGITASGCMGCSATCADHSTAPVLDSAASLGGFVFRSELDGVG